MASFNRFTIRSTSLLLATSTSSVSCVESNFRFGNICVLVTVSDDELLIVDDGTMVFVTVSVTIDDRDVAVTLQSHNNFDDSTARTVSINFPSRFDLLDDCDSPDAVNADTVEAKLSYLVNVPLSISTFIEDDDEL